MRIEIEFKVSHDESRRRRSRAGATQCHLHPRHQLFQRERLGDVVVTTDRETADAICGVVPCGHKEDRGAAATVTEPRQQFEAVQIRKVDVEHDHIGCEPIGLF